MGSVLICGPRQGRAALTKAFKAKGIRCYFITEGHDFDPNGMSIRQDVFKLGASDLPHVDTLYYFPSPDTHKVSDYRKAYIHTLAHLLSIIPTDAKVVYGSSAKVYGNQWGQVVTEDSPCNLESPYAQAIHMGEALLKSRRHLILRLGTIYTDLKPLVARIERGKMCYSQRQHYLNYLHLNDLVRSIMHLEHQQGVMIVSDQQPLALNTLLSLLSSRYGVAVHTPRHWIKSFKGVKLSPQKLLEKGFSFQNPSCIGQPSYSE